MVKSLQVTLSGIYSAYWINGTGASRQEYYQNKRFHQDTCFLTRRNLQSDGGAGSRQMHITARRTVDGIDAGFAARSRSSSTSSECASVDGGRQQVGCDARHVAFGLDDGPADRRGSGSSGERSFDDEPAYCASNPVTPTSLSPPSMHAHAAGSSQQRPAPRPHGEYRSRSHSVGGHVADDLSAGFELAAGTHLFDFCLPLPPKMPSTIVSEVGGIDYNLSAQLKTRGALGRLAGTYLRASCPVHVVNLPSRFAHMLADLPLSDEAVFTKQVEMSWWIMARLSTRTASPGDVLRLGITLSWPGRVAYGDDPERLLRVVSVGMELFEVTVYRSLTTGAVIKSIEARVASSGSGGAAVQEDLVDLAPRSRSRSTASLGHLAYPPNDPAGSLQGSRQGSVVDLLELAITPPESEKSSRSASPSPQSSEERPVARSMFNERFRRTCMLRVPAQRLVGSRARAAGVHIDCRSAPLSVVHEVRMSVRVHDMVTGRLHCIPFAARLVVLPGVEAFELPAYAEAAMDTRVL
ncbi:hypothetical protein GGI15_004556 [Coemansia interrupta]|uniref:Arrestin-like N-terminal domain-containing protein n=1 Tax=Coemansia interrupta TaxID=1126814 RepID=A0A9W8H380_9FUNG|nr:hypothetical protein GGI15_004556 [Coemansia interrupta]